MEFLKKKASMASLIYCAKFLCLVRVNIMTQRTPTLKMASLGAVMSAVDERIKTGSSAYNYIHSTHSFLLSPTIILLMYRMM